MGIRTQAMVLTVVPLVFLLTLFALTAVLVQQLIDAERIGERSAEVLGRTTALAQTVAAANQSLQLYRKSRREADAADWLQTPSRIRTESAALIASTSASTRVAPSALRFVHGIDDLVTYFHSYYDDVRADRLAAANALIIDPATERMVTELSAAKVALDAAQRAETLERLADQRGLFLRIEATMIVVALIGAIATIAVARMFGFQIVRRLEMLSRNARLLASNEPTVTVEGSDEIADLDRVYHAMATRMRESHVERERAFAALEQERTIASTLQQALLPHRLPEIAGLRFDAAYATPLEGMEIGGDWFDVFTLDERHVGMSMGDVAGHGLRAAVTMGTMRQSIRTAARIERSPARVLQNVNRMIEADDPGALVTAFFGVLDQHHGTLTYALAGHPAPIVIELDGSLQTLAGEGLVLGVDPDAEYTECRRSLFAGNAVVMYTDGLVEARRDYLEGLRMLEAAIVAEHTNPALNMADGIQLRVFEGTSPRDDSAVLVVSVLAVARDQEAMQTWGFDGHDAAETHRVRRDVVMYLEDAMPSSYRFNVEVIIGEVLSNIARHTPGPARIIAERRAGTVALHVEDTGPPFELGAGEEPDIFAESGRGLVLMRALSDELQLIRIPDGNRLTIVFHVASDHFEHEALLEPA